MLIFNANNANNANILLIFGISLIAVKGNMKNF